MQEIKNQGTLNNYTRKLRLHKLHEKDSAKNNIELKKEMYQFYENINRIPIKELWNETKSIPHETSKEICGIIIIYKNMKQR